MEKFFLVIFFPAICFCYHPVIPANIYLQPLSLSLSLFLPEFSHIHLLTPSLIQRDSPGKRRESRKGRTRRQPPLSANECRKICETYLLRT